MQNNRILDVFFFIAQSSSEKNQPRNLKRHNQISLEDAYQDEFGEEPLMTKHFKDNNNVEENKEPQQTITYKKKPNSGMKHEGIKENQIQNEELINRLDKLSVQNQGLNTIVQHQNNLIQSLVKIVKGNQTETQNKIATLHGDVAQLTNTLNGFVRAEVNKKKTQQSSKFFL